MDLPCSYNLSTNAWSHDIKSGLQFLFHKQCARSNVCGSYCEALFCKLTGMPLIAAENILASVLALLS